MKELPDGPSDHEALFSGSRRDFLKQSSLLSAIALTPAPLVKAAAHKLDEKIADAFELVTVNLEVNGVSSQREGGTPGDPPGPAQGTARPDRV